MKRFLTVFLPIIGAFTLIFAATFWLDRHYPLKRSLPATAASSTTATPTLAPVDISSEALWATTITDLAGQRQSLSRWQGQWVLLNFWATWCTPCREEMPMLNRVRQELSSQKIEFVGIAADSAEKVRNFVETARIQYPQLVDSELAMTLSKRLGNRLGMLPHTVVIAPDGRVVLNRLGLVQETELRAIFAEKR